jgi:predicted nucleic acid-binding protein
MKHIFLDTNILLDVLAKRVPFYEVAAELFSLADKGEIELFVSALSFANINYILTKMTSADITRTTLLKLKTLVQIIPLDEKAIILSLNDKSFPDFEDGLQYYAAITINADAIITRNLKDFINSTIPAMNAKSFLATL